MIRVQLVAVTQVAMLLWTSDVSLLTSQIQVCFSLAALLLFQYHWVLLMPMKNLLISLTVFLQLQETQIFYAVLLKPLPDMKHLQISKYALTILDQTNLYDDE